MMYTSRARTSRALFHVKQLVFAVLLVGLTSGCVNMEQSLITGNKRAFGYTWEQEVQIGQENDAAIIQQYGLYDNPELLAYVERVGNAVLAESHLRRPETPANIRNTPVTFRLLDSPVVNAFALPGGFVYVTRGLLTHLNNEAQLAVVLGHEIGHVAGRHASKRAANQQFGQLALIGGAILGQATLGGNAAENIIGIGGQATQYLFLSYGRDDERESDDVGVEYAAKAGYMAGEGSAFFTSLKRISDAAGQRIPSFQSTHPDPGEREQTILRHASEWAPTTNMTKVGEAEFLQAIDGMVVGEDPRQGFVENNTFYHPGLRFQFPVPSGYQTINQPSQVVLVESSQQAYVVFTLVQDARSVSDAAQKFAAQEGITVEDQGRNRVGGNEGYYLVATANTEQGQLRLKMQYVSYGGTIYSFMGLSAAAGFSGYLPAFNQVMNGFRALTDPQYLNRQPKRLRVTTANRAAIFESFLGTRLPAAFSPHSMAIINQVDLSQQIQPGHRLKLLQ